MKKVLLSLFIVVGMTIPSFAATTYSSAARVQEVGEKLLTSNGIPKTNIQFMVVSDTPNNSEFINNKVINVSSAELAFAGNDNETAAVVATEIGHIILGHSSKNKVISMLTTPTNTDVAPNATLQTFASNYKTTKQDKEADLVAVNLMVSAGYNPLALIVVLTKQTGTYWDTLVGRPANAEKALNVYDYISYTYPDKLKVGYGCNEYRNFLAYADTITETRKESKKLTKAYNKTYSKAKKNTAKSITKFKTRGGISGWDAVYGLLNTPVPSTTK
ncbi:M48 family metalloprotease [bacterium]|nr:M48 family metalloprotease [bacterium]